MKFLAVATLSLSILLSACATYLQSREDQAVFDANAARAAIASGDIAIRGKVGGEYRRCQNARIQNVFGGVTSAGFVANDEMQQRCNGPSSPSLEDLRKEVFSKIVDGVLKVPPVKVAHDLN